MAAASTVVTEAAPEHPVNAIVRPPRRSALACTRCRQQKMKCSGGPAPPCDRCRKSGSFCIFEPPALPNHHHHHPAFHLAPHNLAPAFTQSPTTAGLVPIAPAARTSPQSQYPTSDHHPTVASSTSASNTLGGASTTSSRHRTSHNRPSSSPADPGENRPRKRRFVPPFRRHDDSPANAETETTPLGDSSDVSSPYQTVQDFEAVHRRPGDGNPSRVNSSSHSPVGPRLPYEAIMNHPPNGPEALLDCLDAVGLGLDEATEMYALFGERIAPYAPWLYDADFSSLPDEPLLALASIRVISRYLPGVTALRSRLDKVVNELLRYVLFDDLSRPYEAVLATMKGLAIIYGYSEVGITSSTGAPEMSKLDVLSIKGIIEGYAVRWNIGKPEMSNSMGCLLWIWLYTMSNYYSILLGCHKTLPAGQHIYKAKRVVEQSFSHPQVLTLLGELELSLGADPESFPSPQPSETGQGVDVPTDWSSANKISFSATSEGRRLGFHHGFARFYRAVRARQQSPSDTTLETLDAGRAFLHCITRASPVIKGRIKYIPDFGFVMLVFVCCFILRELGIARRDPSHAEVEARPDPTMVAALVQDVNDVADLLTSLSSTKGSVPAAYGRALQGACKAFGRHPAVTSHDSSATRISTEPPPSPQAATQFSYAAAAEGPMAAQPAMGEMMYEHFDPAQGTQNFYRYSGTGQADDADSMPWYGDFADIPGGMLLDALNVP